MRAYWVCGHRVSAFTYYLFLAVLYGLGIGIFALLVWWWGW